VSFGRPPSFGMTRATIIMPPQRGLPVAPIRPLATWMDDHSKGPLVTMRFINRAEKETPQSDPDRGGGPDLAGKIREHSGRRTLRLVVTQLLSLLNYANTTQYKLPHYRANYSSTTQFNCLQLKIYAMIWCRIRR